MVVSIGTLFQILESATTNVNFKLDQGVEIA